MYNKRKLENYTCFKNSQIFWKIYSILLFAFNNVNGIIIEKYDYKTFYFINLIAALILLCYSIIIAIYNKKVEKKEMINKNN